MLASRHFWQPCSVAGAASGDVALAATLRRRRPANAVRDDRERLVPLHQELHRDGDLCGDFGRCRRPPKPSTAARTRPAFRDAFCGRSLGHTTEGAPTITALIGLTSSVHSTYGNVEPNTAGVTDVSPVRFLMRRLERSNAPATSASRSPARTDGPGSLATAQRTSRRSSCRSPATRRPWRTR